MIKIPTQEELVAGAVILIDKPLTWTSFDAINKVKRLMKAKIGHCGTLDLGNRVADLLHRQNDQTHY